MAQLELKIGDKTYNKAWVDNLSSTSQISSDPASVNYGVIPSTGNATMRDINGQIRADIENNVLPISNAPTKISINGNQVQEHTTSDSDYNIIDKSLSLQFSDRLSLLDKVTYGGMPLREYQMTAYDMLDDVIGSYGGYCREKVVNWTKYQHGDVIQTTTYNNLISVKTGSGYEIIGAPVKVVPNVQHTVRFAIKNINEYTALNPPKGIAVQVLNSVPTDTDCSTISLATTHLEQTANVTTLGNMQFTTSKDTVYFVINFGWAADDQDVAVEIASVTIDGKALSRSTQNKCFSGNYVDSTGDTKISTQTVGDILSEKIIDYPYLPQASYRETIEKFCTLGQLTVALDEDGAIQFYGTRPCYANETIRNIPNSYKISNLQKTLFLKNKIDGVDIKQDKVKDERVSGANIFNGTYDAPISTKEATGGANNSIFTPTSKLGCAFNTMKRGEAGSDYYQVYAGINSSWGTYKIRIPKYSDNNLKQVLDVWTNSDSDSISFSTEYKYVTQGFVFHTNPHATSEPTDFSFIGYPSIQGKNEPLHKVSHTAYSDKNSELNCTITINDDQKISGMAVTDGGDYFELEVSLQQSTKWYNASSNYNTSSGLSYGLGTGTLYTATVSSISITIRGIERRISFEEVDASSANIENATTTVSVPTSELMQGFGYVKIVRDNILSDYANGVPTATADVFCGLGDWKNGEVIKPNEIVTFDDDIDDNGDKNYWRVTGRTFKYQGAPTLSLELQRQKRWHQLWHWSGSIVKDDVRNASGGGDEYGYIELPFKVENPRNTFIRASITYMVNNASHTQTASGYANVSDSYRGGLSLPYINCRLSLNASGTRLEYYAQYIQAKPALVTYNCYVKKIELEYLSTTKFY